MSSMTGRHVPCSQDIWSRPSSTNPYSVEPSYVGQSEGAANSTWFTGGLPTPPGKTMNGTSMGSTLPTYPSNHVYSIYHPTSGIASVHRPNHSQHSGADPSHHSRMSSMKGIPTHQGDKNADSQIARHLQIPESVNKSKGSLAEFATEITSLFWFESSTTLEYAENLSQDAPVDRGLTPDARPSTGFRKWVTTILSTTQVGKNVILLALMFIYRLKKFNPSVSGKRGSEFRLLTIALMLGNKFLDDNTYTNKTWAEVSGISVTEIHIMEVEFLSNMRYDLYVSESEWKDWKATLGRLGAFYEKASNFGSGLSPVTPLSQSFGQKLPSPPSTHHSQQSYQGTLAPLHSYVGLPNPVSNAPALPPSPLRQQRGSSVDLLNGRKRSLDFGSEQSAAKRMHVAPNAHTPASMLTPSSYSSHGSGAVSVPPMSLGGSLEGNSINDIPRLPMPRLAVPPTMTNSNQLAPLGLPPNRAMSSVYPAVTSATWSQNTTPVSTVPPSLYQNALPSRGDLSQSHSNAPSANTSPIGYATNTPILPGLSPSYFLTNRSSPYRPVRLVNTLVNPPPSAALHHHPQNIDQDQIHYQPLSKVSTERRMGPIPFMQPDGWQGSNANTPIQQKWPYRF